MYGGWLRYLIILKVGPNFGAFLYYIVFFCLTVHSNHQPVLCTDWPGQVWSARSGSVHSCKLQDKIEINYKVISTVSKICFIYFIILNLKFSSLHPTSQQKYTNDIAFMFVGLKHTQWIYLFLFIIPQV